jgi:hypothetical protein
MGREPLGEAMLPTSQAGPARSPQGRQPLPRGPRACRKGFWAPLAQRRAACCSSSTSSTVSSPAAAATTAVAWKAKRMLAQ